MTDDIARLGIEVDSTQAKNAARNLDELVNSGRKAEGQAKKIGQEYNKTNSPLSRTAKGGKDVSSSFDQIDRSAKRAATQTGALTSSLKSLVAPLAASLGTREIAKSAEQWTQLNNRLSLVTNSTEELVDAQNSVFAIAQSSRQPLSESAELYQRIATNADALRLSGSGVAEVVDKISKTLAISGTSGQAASAALTQLGQAFASGTLRGEELNSVLEQAPALAKSIADGMGVTVGELRALGQEGTLTAETVVNALLNQGDAIDEQFGKIQATGGQAFTVLGNSITRVIGELNDASGAGNAFADTVIGLSQFLDSGALTEGIIYEFELFSSVLDDVTDGINIASNYLNQFSSDADQNSNLIVDALSQIPVNLTTWIKLFYGTEIPALVDRVLAAAEAIKDGVKAIFTEDTLSSVAERFKKDMESISEIRRDSISAILDERQATLDAADAVRAKREEERKASEERREAAKANLGAGATGQVGDLSGGGSDAKIVDLAKIREQLATADQSVESSFVKRQDALAAYLENATLMQDEYNSLTLANVAKYNEEISALEQKRRDEKLGALEDSFNQLQISQMSETELENTRYENQLATLTAAREAGLASITSYNDLEQSLAAQHQDNLTKITAKGLTDRQKFQALSMKDQAKEMFGLLAQQTQAAAQHNKTAFEANKVAAIANATISTYEGVAKAWSFGPILGPVFAALVAAGGIANVQAIASQSFGGGSGVAPSIAGTGATSATAITNQSPTALQAQQPQQEQGPRVVLNFSGPVTGLDEDILAGKITELIDRDYIQGFA